MPLINASLMGNTLSIDDIDMAWLSKMEIRGIHLHDQQGDDLVSCKEIILEYDITSLRDFEFQSLSVEIKEPVIYVFEREGNLNWNTAFPSSESNEASEPISGSPVEIEEVFVRIDSPRVVINQEEPFTLKALEL